MEEAEVTFPSVDVDDVSITDGSTGWLSGISLDPTQFWSLIERGGPVVTILALLSVAALTVIIFKAAQFLLRRVGNKGRSEKALKSWFAGNRENAINMTNRSRTPNAVVLHHAMQGLGAGLAEEVVREDSERVAMSQIAELKSFLRILESISQIAPLLGLFGTVIGMMSAFQALQSAGADADPAVLAGGIWVALITTAVGLAVAIPTSFCLYWFEGRIEKETGLIEGVLTSLFTGRLQHLNQATAGKTQSTPTLSVAPHAAE